MIKRLIFDVDNTLIVGADFTDSIIKMTKELGMYSEETVNNFFKGESVYKSIYNNYNYSDYKKHMEEYMNVIMPDNFLDVLFECLANAVPERNDKLISTIDTLSKKYELVLLTDFFSKPQLSRLNNIGIGKYFTEVYGEDLIKPNRDAFIKACGPNKPEECVMIGDSIVLDANGAINAGLKAIFVNTKKIDTSNFNFVTVDKVEDITEEVLNKLD